MAQIEDKEENPPVQSVPISGRFDQYRSSFWAAALAFLPIRYFPRPFLRGSWESENFYTKHVYSGIAGLFMEGVTGYFALQTRKDMYSIFSQALAWEFDKDPKDVSFSDLRNSKNTMVQQTVGNYISRNLKRIAVNSFFFLPYVFGPFFKKFNILKGKWHPDNWHPESGADLGLGANAAYLISDVLSRRQTPFESLQSIIDRKINHAESPGDEIEVTDLLDIYERNAARTTVSSFLKHRGTPDWERSMSVFTRMADLMNQTYKNVAPKENADFTMPKFIYMAGNGLIHPEKVEQTLVFIEVANRYGIPALKEVVKEIESGAELSQALQKYPVIAPKEMPALETAAPGKKYTDGLAMGIGSARTMAQPPAAYADKALKDADLSHSLSA